VKLDLELELPEGLLDENARAELVRHVREQAVIKLITDGRVTTREGAKLLAMIHVEFLDLLKRTGVRFQVDLDNEDLMMMRIYASRFTGA
jgi:predicted HTH domain antitoxin